MPPGTMGVPPGRAKPRPWGRVGAEGAEERLWGCGGVVVGVPAGRVGVRHPRVSGVSSSVPCPLGGPGGREALGAGYGGKYHERFTYP
ncbi:hypothetical protein F8144_18535 [Streptomyces triticiradicis]|uniref:Uncharacterized protein n=1 Tax=Streptomyces triticiradicis TaxID=2651189 RepID=A0A7J5DGN3_9ACTN|nr:hypothetical protein F8144_18535 [Streptomyces triticiradicis]